MMPNQMLCGASQPKQSGKRLPPLALLAGAFLASGASAGGFGDLVLHSRIGEELLIEVQLPGISKGLTDPACYTLAPKPGSDLPVITDARIHLIHNKDAYQLLIVGNRAITEPAFVISLRANCGVNLRHDYTLIPDAPPPPAEVLETEPDQANRPKEQEIKAITPKPPKNKERAKTEKRNKRPLKPGNSQSDAIKSLPITKQSKITGDHLRLSSAPLELKPEDNAGPESRLLKMETSLSSLNREMEPLNTSLQLSKEVQQARHDLLLAEKAQQTAARTSARTEPPDAPQRAPSANNWLELILGSLLGGTLVIGATVYLRQRKQRNSGD